MAIQNLVSGALTPEQMASVTQGLSTIKGALPILITLQPQQKKEFVRVGNTYVPFIEMAHSVVTDHPEIVPGVFNIAEFNRDYQLPKDLRPYLNQIEELAESILDTIFAANSDAMTESLEVYAAVQQNKDKIPGMDTIAAKMAEFFKKGRRMPPPAAQK
ncbi:MAG: hypothetical protein B7Z63_04590 [Ignavibacteriae bacterium 37-53-5]|nr:MAG: hypothetical protein B7Z63_04590 [Ignavibacteriae bacterium 37-53-5]